MLQTSVANHADVRMVGKNVPGHAVITGLQGQISISAASALFDLVLAPLSRSNSSRGADHAPARTLRCRSVFSGNDCHTHS